MQKTIVSLVIIALVIVVVVGGYSYREYQKGVNRVLNYSIYSSLNMTQSELLDIRTELKAYEGKQLTAEELQNIVSKSRDYFFYGDYTKKYDNNISMDFAYINYLDLNSYMTSLAFITVPSTKEIPAEEIEYHKENLLKIIKLWAPHSFNVTDNYIQPPPRLRKLIEETNSLANDGMKRLDDYYENLS